MLKTNFVESMGLAAQGSSQVLTVVNEQTGQVTTIGYATSNSAANGSVGSQFVSCNGTSSAPNGNASYTVSSATYSLTSIPIPTGGWSNNLSTGISTITFTFSMNANLTSAASVTTAKAAQATATASGEDDGLIGATLN